MLVCGLLITTSLHSQVEVKGSGNTSSTNTFITKNSDNDTSMLIQDDGKIGIGNTSPSAKLDVNGRIRNATGGIEFPDGTVQYTASGASMYQNVFTVAQSGGDFTSIVNALAACTSPSPVNRYLIRVMPGIYTEPGIVFCKKFVDMSGSGKYSCVINAPVQGQDSCLIENFHLAQGLTCSGVSPFVLHNVINSPDIDNGTGILIETINPESKARPWIKENEILDCNGYGIVCQGFGSDAWILANKILRNAVGGINCIESSPTISNNIIDNNMLFGIHMIGVEGFPAEPTIDDNVISNTGYTQGGHGIHMLGLAEPRIFANDIYINECGIWIDGLTQPSIHNNNINYNFEAGIRCYSSGASKPPVIQGNHIHSNCPGDGSGSQPAGIYIFECSPIITHNDVINNDRAGGGTDPDIDYMNCTTTWPTISYNVYDIRFTSATPALGQYNTTSAGTTWPTP